MTLYIEKGFNSGRLEAIKQNPMQYLVDYQAEKIARFGKVNDAHVSKIRDKMESQKAYSFTDEEWQQLAYLDHKKKEMRYFTSGYIEPNDNGTNKRSDSSLIRRDVFILDYDDLNTDYDTFVESVTSVFEGLELIIYPTIKYHDKHPRMRLILPIDRPLVKFEYLYMMKEIASKIPYPYDSASFTWAQCMGLPVITSFNQHRPLYHQTGAPYPTPLKIEPPNKPTQPNHTTINATSNEIITAFTEYVEWDKDNLMDYNKALHALLVLVKTYQEGSIDIDTLYQCAEILAMGNDAWVEGNYNIIRANLDREVRTDWTFKSKFVDLMAKTIKAQQMTTQHYIQELETLTFDDYKKAIELIKGQVKKGITNSKSNPYSFDMNGILWEGDSIESAKPVRNYLNCEKLWALFTELVFNDFTSDIEIYDFKEKKLRQYRDTDDAEIFKIIAKTYSVEVSKKYWDTIPYNIAIRRTYHPLKQRIETLAWDGVPRVETYFIDLLGCEDNTYTREVTKVWFAGLIKRIYEPGCKFEIVPILVGEQGAGKSTACHIIFPDYFTDSLKGFGQNKDDYQMLEQVVIVELGELKGLKKAEIADVKNFISARYDTIRKAYGRRVNKMYRHNVFIGTSNPSDFLKDDTGERRFYPLKVKVQEPTIRPWDVEEEYLLQVLAEAKKHYENGQPLVLTPSTINHSKEIQKEFKIEDPMKDAILKYLNMKVPNCWFEMDLSERQNQYRKWCGLPVDPYKSYKTYDIEECNEELDRTSINEIAFIVFGEDPIKYKTILGTHGKIRSTLDNLEGWKRKRVVLEKGANPSQGYVKDVSFVSSTHD